MADRVPSLEDVVASLTRDPVKLDEAMGHGGLPDRGGLYAWWTKPDSIPGVPASPHPTQDLDLFYVGIAPKDSRSQATLGSRVVGNHINGNTGSSTFRKTLAALLFEIEGWQPRMTDRPLLTKGDNASLRDWQHQHLRLTWAEHPRPWEIEDEVIAELSPPLNLAGNRSHPFWQTVTDARASFKAAADRDLPETLAPEPSKGPSIPMAAPSEGLARISPERVKLHDEIADILRENGNRWMTTEELARAVARRKRYVKRDGTSKVTAFQIHGRTKESGSYAHIFERNGSKLRLRAP